MVGVSGCAYFGVDCVEVGFADLTKLAFRRVDESAFWVVFEVFLVVLKIDEGLSYLCIYIYLYIIISISSNFILLSTFRGQPLYQE